MRALLIATVLSAAGGAACAQPAGGPLTGMESCFQSARGTDSICSNPANDAVQRLGCLQKARTTLLECLEQVPQGITAGSIPSERTVRTAAPEMPAVTASSELTTGTVLQDKPTAAVSSEKPATATSSDKPTAAVSSEKPSAVASPGMPTAAVSPDKPVAAASPDMPTPAVSSDKSAGAASPEMSTAAVSPEKSAMEASPDPPARAVDIAPKPRDPNWIISETTSPVDYAPVITAAIRLPFSVKHAPNTFAIRCRGRRTEVVVRTEGTWRASRASEVEVDYQINDQPVVRLPWTTSADGKTAIYKDDPVGLLQSLPDGARLKVNVVDGPGPSHEATFQLSGLDAVREKIAAACKWAPAVNKVSSEKR
jgi:hypothetical protein